MSAPYVCARDALGARDSAVNSALSHGGYILVCVWQGVGLAAVDNGGRGDSKQIRK